MKSFLQLRVPIAISFIIVLLALTLSWRNHLTITRLRNTHQTLLTQTSAAGITPTDPLPVSTRQPKKNPLQEAERVAARFIAYGRDMKGIYHEGHIQELDQATRDRMAIQMNEVIALNGKQLEHLIALISKDSTITEDVRLNLLQFSLTRLGTLHPQIALDLLCTPPLKDQLGGGYSRSIAENIANIWNAQAPDAFLDWFRENRTALPPNATTSILYGLSLARSVTTPLELFPFLKEFSPDPAGYFPHILQKSTLTLSDRHECLTQIRELAETLPDPKKRKKYLLDNNRALILGQTNHGADFETATAFATSGIFTPDDLEFLWNPAICDLSYNIKKEDTGRWIDWLQKNFPDGKADHRIKQLLKR
ncbi:hypothetical protein V2O64_12920 [Verrucomicrobiaceae bacterium 227]